ncbi:hypothetical protein GCM10010207_16800 [Streptomyces atratus]|nr:hypothetical protein GCM10010207_16800 [Streptomyces atratus]
MGRVWGTYVHRQGPALPRKEAINAGRDGCDARFAHEVRESVPHLGAHDGRCGLRRHHDRGVRVGGSRRQGGGEAVTAENIVGLIVAVALLGYLVLALLYPERF